MYVLVIEDDSIWQLKISMMLNLMGILDHRIVPSFAEATTLVAVEEPTLIISDVVLSDGVVFDQTTTLFNSKPTIFVTSNAEEEFFQKSKDYTISTFIVKPFHQFTLQSAIDSLLTRKAISPKIDPTKTIRVRGKHGNIIYLNLDFIEYIQGEGNYVTIHYQDKKFVCKASLKKTLEKLDERFVQIQKAFIVNKKYIKRIDMLHSSLYVNATQIPIGRFYKKLVVEMLTNF